MPHSLATELNDVIKKEAPRVFETLSSLGREFYFPKGILTQTAEAKQKATRYNATIGIAREGGKAMNLPSVMKQFTALTPDEALNYAPSPGHPDLRAEWKRQMLEKNPSLKDKAMSLPLVTTGITHGLSLVADMFADPGDVVLTPDKVWGNYNMVFGVRRGARMARYPMFGPGGTGFDAAGFRAALKAHAGKGKLIVLLNFPNNPSGYTVTSREAEEIARALIETAEAGCNVVAAYDDAYFGLFFEEFIESPFTRAAGKHPGLLAVKLDGATKEDYVWGLRVGFVTFAAGQGGAGLYAALEKKAGGCVRGAVSNASQLSQSVALKAMKSPDYAREKKEKFEVMKARYAEVKKVLADGKFAEVWTPYPFNSGYFMCVRLKNLNAEAFRLGLLEKEGIGVIATAPTDVRVAFSCLNVDQVSDFFNRLYACAKEMEKDPAARDLSRYAEAFEE